MSQYSIMWPTSTTGDGASKITDAQWREVLRMLFVADNTLQGVIYNHRNQLAVSGAASPLSVATGGAIDQGFLYWSDAIEEIDLPVVASPTGFRIVVQAIWGTTRTVRVAVIQSNEGVATIPSVTQVDGTRWEISLASGVVNADGTVATGAPTDTRSFIHFNTKVSTGMLDDDAVTNAKIADDAVDTAQIADDAVTSAQIADDAVGTAQIADDAVTSAQIAANAVGAPEIAAGAVGTSELADDSVTDEKAGNRIIQLPLRQGNSATDWQDAGSGSQTPGAIRMHVGARNCVINAGNADGTITNLAYPTAYSDKPWVNATVVTTPTQKVVLQLENITATDFDVRVTRKDETDTVSEWTALVLWQSIGGA